MPYKVILKVLSKKVWNENFSKKSEIQYFLPVNMENEAQMGNLCYKHNTKICKYMNINGTECKLPKPMPYAILQYQCKYLLVPRCRKAGFRPEGLLGCQCLSVRPSLFCILIAPLLKHPRRTYKWLQKWNFESTQGKLKKRKNF